MYCKCPHHSLQCAWKLQKCIEKNIEEKSVCYCMEHNAELLGAKLPGKFPVTEIYDSEKDMENPTGSIFCSHGAGFYVPWNEVKDYMHVKTEYSKQEEKKIHVSISKEKTSFKGEDEELEANL